MQAHCREVRAKTHRRDRRTHKEVDIVIYSGDSLALTLGGKEVLLE